MKKVNMLKENIQEKDNGGVIIVDTYPIVRQGLTEFIDQQTELFVCGTAENAHQALRLIADLKPEMAIIDVSLKGLSGIELIKMIKAHHPQVKILVFSIFNEFCYAERAIQAGAKGYIMKKEPLKKIITAIRKVLQGEIYISDTLSEKLMQKIFYNHAIGCNSLIELLSDRELEVFRLIGRGYGTRGIADKLCLSLRTIEAYRGRIKNKLNIKNAESLLQQAIQWVKSES